MKKVAAVIMAAVIGAVLLACPAGARSLAWIRFKSHPVHYALNAPFYALGFGLALLADVTVYPLYKGAKHYIESPAIGGW